MKEGEFRVLKETEYGPQLVRVGSSADPERATLDQAETALGAVDESKRNFLFGASVLGGALAVGGVRKLLESETSDSPSFQVSEGKIGGSVEHNHRVHYRTESGIESGRYAEKFKNELTGYQALFGLKKNEVVFVDKNNVPVGGPVQLQDIVAPKFHKDGRLQMRQYRYSPGQPNEIGIPNGGISGEWLELVRDGLAYNYPDRVVERPLHAVIDFNSAVAWQDEPELAAAIKRGDVNDYRGLVKYFAEKPVVGAEQMSRIEYVQNKIKFDDTIPAVVQDELRRILPGLCAQESKFNNGLTSIAGARGIFQFMPDTWAHYGGMPEEINSLKRQVEIAGKFFSDVYHEVRTNIGKESLQFLEMKLGSRDELERRLVVPLMVNSYNAGSSRMAEAVREYIRNTAVEDMPEGEDLFLAIADYAIKNRRGRLVGYGQHAREYVPRIYAQAEVLRGE